MPSLARQYTLPTIKKLFALSGDQCAFPDCVQLITEGGNSGINITNICHIEAAEPGGERYNPNMTDDERRDFKNLLLLCPTHHLVTNDVENYPASVMYEMKLSHEQIVKSRASGEVLYKYPSALADVIKHIATADLKNILDEIDLPADFNIDAKIEHNNVQAYRPTLEEYRAFHGKINSIYNEYERSGFFEKDLLLRNVKKLYLEAKGEILNGDFSIKNIRNHADELIRGVETKLWDLLERSSNKSMDLSVEATSFILSLIVVDAFMRCKILEEPINYAS